jgi:hypothetical protein
VQFPSTKTMRRIPSQHARGVSLVEMVVVSAVLGTTMLFVIGGVRTSVQLSILSVERAQSAALLEEGAEVVRFLRDSAWTNISNKTVGTNYYPLFTGGTWTLTTTPTTIGEFTRTVVFANAYRDGSNKFAASGTLDADSRLVTITNQWSTLSGTRTESLTLYISNIF